MYICNGNLHYDNKTTWLLYRQFQCHTQNTILIFGWFLALLNYPVCLGCTNLHTTVFWNDTTCGSLRATYQTLRETSCLHLIL